MTIETITTTPALRSVCEALQDSTFITVDTEFVRDKTYWPILCLIQVSGPEAGSEVAIDPLADGIDLAPLHDLLANPAILKIFHAARQDLEIFFHAMGKVPHPIFDTQVAAMVCGYGDQVGYEALVRKISDADLDKSSRMTDWARRPLNERQLAYALSDVTYLRDIYLSLSAQLDRNGRTDWLKEEMAVLTTPGTYTNEPADAWKRIKVRTNKPKFLAVLSEIAAWREVEAQTRDLPRNRILKDESLLDVAGSMPRSIADLARIRGVGQGFADGKLGKSLLSAVERGLNLPKSEIPSLRKSDPLPQGLGPLTDLLKVLLKRCCEEVGVASRLVATSDDLERIAADDNADVPALKGWRRELFGEEALRLKQGKIALSAEGKTVKLIHIGVD